MPGRHHSRGPVEDRSEVVPVTQLGLTGRQPHPHGKYQFSLRRDRSIDSRFWRGERGAHPVAGVLKQETAVCLDRVAQHLVMNNQSYPHFVGIGLPPTCRPLDVGEQERHHPRRWPDRGHSRRMSHLTRAYFLHCRIRPVDSPAKRR